MFSRGGGLLPAGGGTSLHTASRPRVRMEGDDFLAQIHGAQLGLANDSGDDSPAASRPRPSPPAPPAGAPKLERLIELDIQKATQVLQRQGALRAWRG